MIHILHNTIDNVSNKINIQLFIISGLQCFMLYGIYRFNNKLNKLLKHNDKLYDYTNIELDLEL